MGWGLLQNRDAHQNPWPKIQTKTETINKTDVSAIDENKTIIKTTSQAANLNKTLNKTWDNAAKLNKTTIELSPDWSPIDV